MALVLPLLLLLVFGIIEFGRVFNTQLAVTHAAREGIRHYAITGEAGTASGIANDAASGLDLSSSISIQGDCFPTVRGDETIGTAVSMVITYTDFTGFIPLWGTLDNIELTGTGTMRCGG